jgi:DNA polymerase V
MNIRGKILHALAEKNMTQRELARRLGMSSGSLSRIIMGKVQPTLPTLQRIARTLGKSLEYFDEDFDPFGLKEESAPYGCRRLPLLAQLPAGNKQWVEDDVLERIDIPIAFVGKQRRMFLIKATGDSMEGAGIFCGDLVAVACGREIANGCIVVMRVDGEAVVRRYRELKDKIRLEPANPKYASEEYNSRREIDIKGVVVWSGRKHV